MTMMMTAAALTMTKTTMPERFFVFRSLGALFFFYGSICFRNFFCRSVGGGSVSGSSHRLLLPHHPLLPHQRGASVGTSVSEISSSAGMSVAGVSVPSHANFNGFVNAITRGRSKSKARNRKRIFSQKAATGHVQNTANKEKRQPSEQMLKQ